MTLEGGLREDSWLGDRLRRPAYRLELDDRLAVALASEDSPERLRLREALSRPAFISCKVPTGSVEECRLLADLGFRLIDTLLVFDKELTPREKPGTEGSGLRLAVPDDRNEVLDIARESFVFSRFHNDPGIDRKLANLLKGEWVGGFFEGRRGDALAVATLEGRIAGFLLLLENLDAGDLVIDLVAVHRDFRRRRVAASLISWVEQRFRACTRYVVGTQVANVPSIRCYEGLGFRMKGSSYVFHAHGRGGDESR